MEMEITFPKGARVDASVGQHVIKTDQPPQGGGAGSAPTPFSVFLASIGTCAGIYVLGFCRQRGLPTDGLRITQRNHPDPNSGMINRVELQIELPKDFPEQYYEPLIRAADLCAVKKHLQDPPEFDITAR